MKKRLLAWVLTLCLLLAVLPGVAGAEGQEPIELTQDNYKKYLITTGWSGSAFLNTGSYILTGDITFAGGDFFSIGLNSANEGEHSTVTLDLNGHVLMQTRDYTPVIGVYGGSSLTILDSRPNVPHKFSVDSAGRWQLDEDGGNEVVYGGIITSTGVGTAFRIHDFRSEKLSAICTMNGGNIVGGTFEHNGGGVFVDYFTEFIMNGGSIRGCTVGRRGGGVYVLGTFKMNGGTISDCKAALGGDALYVDPDGNFSMSANAKIDDTVYGAYTVTFESNGGSTVPPVWCANAPALKPADPTKPGYTFAGWYTDSECTTAYDFDKMNVTGAITLYAKWTPAPVTPTEDPTTPWWSLLPALEQTADFPFYDVDANDWFYESVKSAWEQELIDGVTARYFKPDNTLTVAQAIKLAAALHQKQSVGFVTLQNGGTHWYDNYVNYAAANGLIEAAYQGKSAEAMNAAVSRAEFVHILAKLLDARSINTVNSIPDVKSGDAYADEIFAFYRAGILTGSDRLGTFHPMSSLKRSEAAAILVRLYDASQRQYITLR